jgi:MFS family permease
MNRNIKVVLLVSIFFGFSIGLYDFALPFFLKEQGLSYTQMGYIFAISSVIMFVVRIYLGNLSDRLGRKLFYAIALAVSAVTNGLAPFATKLFPAAALKSAREGANFTREVMHPVVLYELAPAKFLSSISITRGLEIFSQGMGTLAAGLLLAISFKVAFGVSGALLAVAFIVFVTLFHEDKRPASTTPPIRLRDLLNFDVSPNLKLIGISSFILAFAMGIGHSYIMPLFFSVKFHASNDAVAVILMIHRFSFAVPMLFAGIIPRRHFKQVFIIGMILQGIFLTVSAVIPNLIAAAAVWLLHDLIGASFWVPVQNTIVQEFSRHDVRGSDVSKTLALGALGGIGGQLIAGDIAQTFSVSAAFLVGGIFTLIAVIPLFKLNLAANGVEQYGAAKPVESALKP